MKTRKQIRGANWTAFDSRNEPFKVGAPLKTAVTIFAIHVALSFLASNGLATRLYSQNCSSFSGRPARESMLVEEGNLRIWMSFLEFRFSEVACLESVVIRLYFSHLNTFRRLKALLRGSIGGTALWHSRKNCIILPKCFLQYENVSCR